MSLAFEILPGGQAVVACQAGAGEEGLVAAGVAAEAGVARPFVVARPGQGIVAPFAGNRVRANEDAAVDDDAAADPGSDDDPEDDVAARARAVGGLGQGEAVGVVGHPDLAAERLAEILVERVPDELDRVGVLDQARSPVKWRPGCRRRPCPSAPASPRWSGPAASRPGRWHRSYPWASGCATAGARRQLRRWRCPLSSCHRGRFRFAFGRPSALSFRAYRLTSLGLPVKLNSRSAEESG